MTTNESCEKVLNLCMLLRRFLGSWQCRWLFDYFIWIDLIKCYSLYNLLSTGICFKEWKGNVSACWEESLWWSSQFVREGLSPAGGIVTIYIVHFINVLHVLKLFYAGYFGHYPECWASSWGIKFNDSI